MLDVEEVSPCSLSACPVLITLHHELGSVYLLLLLVARKERSVAPYRDAGREFIKTSYLELVAQIPAGSGHRCSASSGLFHTPSEELFKDPQDADIPEWGSLIPTVSGISFHVPCVCSLSLGR